MFGQNAGDFKRAQIKQKGLEGPALDRTGLSCYFDDILKG